MDKCLVFLHYDLYLNELMIREERERELCKS